MFANEVPVRSPNANVGSPKEWVNEQFKAHWEVVFDCGFFQVLLPNHFMWVMVNCVWAVCSAER
jgi:hypothetical protein